MIKKLCYYGNPILRTRCKEVENFDDELKAIFEDLCDTINAHPSWGIAAPQIGCKARIFIINYYEKDADGYPIATKQCKAYVNPKITVLDDRVWVHGESCMSVPDVYVEVERPWAIRIEAFDVEGNPFFEEHEGWMARPILHENDHLNGVLNIDRTPKKQRRAVEPELKRIRKKYN